MTIAQRIEQQLRDRQIPYEVLAHPYSSHSSETAELAHVSGTRIAKAVILTDGESYLAAVLPADCHVHLGELRQQLQRPLGLATEDEVAGLFEDCEPGAIPALTPLYGLETVVDEHVAEQPEVYCEAGDHESLIRLSGEDFADLISEADVRDFATQAWHEEGRPAPGLAAR